MDPLRSSVMSLGLHEDLGTSGSEIDPSNTRVGKHSRNVAEKVIMYRIIKITETVLLSVFFVSVWVKV